MKHEHKETVSYDGGDENSSYTRTYKHKHLFDHAAHTHVGAWEGDSKNKTQHRNMLEDTVPVVRVGRDILQKGDS